jgi:hypothetical protein
MKMNRLNPFLFLMAFMVSFGFAACGSDDDGNKEEPVDTEKPVIELTTPENDGSYSKSVGDFFISGKFTDNVALDTCTFSININSKSASSLKSIDDPVDWEPDAVGFSLSGKEKSFSNEDIFGKIWDNARPDSYTLNIEVIDAAGNTATERISFNITE